MRKLYKRNKYRIRFCLFLILLVAILPSCKKDWLEAKVDKKQAVPETAKDFQAMLDSFFSINNSDMSLTEIAADGHYYTDANFNTLKAGTSFYASNLYAWTPIRPFENTAAYDSRYSDQYRIILDMNIVLDEVEKSHDPDKIGLDHIKGQALFHRSRSLFMLSQTYAPGYKASSANSDLGIPLRLSTDITQPSKRSTIQQSYDQIISDLIIAKDLLPIVPSFLTRASKPAALGMLAKVYLAMGDYTKAFNSSDEYLQIKNDLLDYSSISISAPFIGINKEVTYISFLIPSQLTSSYLIDQSLYNSYDNNDLRKQVFFKTGAAGVTFKGTYGNSATDLFGGISTDEMYLIRAECFARNGNLPAAMKDLNDLSRTRWAKNVNGSTKYIDQTASDETDALKRIFTERKKQLILRNVRWTDLRRMNLDDRFKTTLTRTVGSQTYTLEPNSPRYTLPMPSGVIQLSGMVQNPGWE